MVDEISQDADVVSFVNETENSIATTKDHYGDYLAFLMGFASTKSKLYVMTKGILKAGANKCGVISALNILIS